MRQPWLCCVVRDMMSHQMNKNKHNLTDIVNKRQTDKHKHKIRHLLMMIQMTQLVVITEACLVVRVVLVVQVVLMVLAVLEITIIWEMAVYHKEISLVIRMLIYCLKLQNKSKIRKTKKRSPLTRQLMNNQSNRKKKCQVKMAAEYNNNHWVKILLHGHQYHQINQILQHKVTIIQAKMDRVHKKTWSLLNKKRKDKPV
jgi:hypothetical protein